MDPYCVIKLGDCTKRTTTLDEAGKDPAWIELYSLLHLNALDKLTLTVFDEDVTTDDLVGEVSVDPKEKGMLEDTGTNFKEWTLDLMYEGKKAGEISFATRYTQSKE